MDSTFNRRRFLKAGGVTAGATLLSGLLPARAEALPNPPALLDIHRSATAFFDAPINLASTTIMQSYGFDNVNKRIYTAQLTSGGSLGELTITKLDYSGGEVEPSWVHLKGFGHGFQIGVQPTGGSAYIWVETLVEDDDSNPQVNVTTAGATGYGTQIARFKFNDFDHGASITPTTSGVDIYKPRPTYGRKSVAIDPYYNRISLRYHIASDTVRHDLFDLDAFSAHDYSSPLHSQTIVDLTMMPKNGGAKPTFQGHATFGDYFYMLTGEHDTDNMMLWAWSWADGTIADSFKTEAGISLPWREPEGMSIWIPDSDPFNIRMTFGIASGSEGARKASIYYK